MFSRLPWSTAALLALALVVTTFSRPAEAQRARRPLVISAIPDQDPEKLNRLYGSLATYLSRELGVPVMYKPVTDYVASVTAFRVGDLDLVWYGGLTGVQARLQVPGARVLAQRDIDTRFRSVFIAGKNSGITNLAGVRGRTFTFGSESSTSGRLMPQFFLGQQGIRLTDFKGRPGFSGTHDKTLALVAAGSFDAGALNEQVWKKRLAEKAPDTQAVRVIAVSPPFHDYHWVLHPEAVRQFGGEPFVRRLSAALFKLTPKNPQHAQILDLFGAKRFVPARPSDYVNIEKVGREAGLIVGRRRARQ